LCAATPSLTLGKIARELDACEDLHDEINQAIIDEAPISVRDGGLIKPGYHEHLDELREASINGKRWIAELEARERVATGIKSLKIGFNKVFGYYIEITKSHIASVPEGRYERKQTLANAERYVTPELKEKEGLILEAQEKMVDLEYALFTELREKLSKQIPRLQSLAEKVAELDVYQSLAATSAEHGFVKPVLTEDYDLIIEGGRHPVVEAVMKDSAFISNATNLSKESANILLITGPNMAGKSTYMRQVALISIMAQIGCFVPANKAEIPMVDRIFTRIRAADDLIGGQSTFMVEMADIQVMTEKATPRSLIIIDELGRGTSTSEGMAIAQAVIEYVHDEIGCKALVSTHFHELSHIEGSLKGLRNYSMAVQESGDKVHFLRKLIPGAAGSSYGVYCARLAGLPDSIIDRANVLLESLDHTTITSEVAAVREVPSTMDKTVATEGAVPAGNEVILNAAPVIVAPDVATNGSVAATVSYNEPTADKHSNSYLEDEIREVSDVVQLSIFGEEELKPTKKESVAPMNRNVTQIIDSVKNLDLMNMTPLQAMQLLHELSVKAKGI